MLVDKNCMEALCGGRAIRSIDEYLSEEALG
jgi:hypothetical protein